ncbi:MAG: two-component system LytT family sensor kinase [Halieaceae bacterium]|jgi:two-component system LytT family sensor kinase
MQLNDRQLWVDRFREDRDWQFWIFQLLGWAGYSLVTFFALTVWDDNVSWPHVGHILVQAVLGILCSWPLRPVYARIFEMRLLEQVIWSGVVIVIASLIWTALRLQTFAWILGHGDLWLEFNYWFFGSMFVFSSWTSFYFGIQYYLQAEDEHRQLVQESALKQQEHVRRLHAESTARDAQLQMLRYQLNPHFLFNTLNSINALVNLEEKPKALDMIQHLSAFLRHSLDNDSIEKVTVEREIEALKLYLEIEKARFEDRLVLHYDVGPETAQALVPGLILQPLVENAIKYAVAASETGGSIRICAKKRENKLVLEVSDSGPDIGNGTLAEVCAADDVESRGVGLCNTVQRLETTYYDNFSFDTSAAGTRGFTVTITVPFETLELIPAW